MSLPIYIRIHNDIRRKVENNQWQIGSQIPPERELAIQYHVSRMTLRQAIHTLVDEGILDHHIGSGTFVAHRKVQEQMSGITSFTDIMLEQQKIPSSKTISYYTVAPSLSEMEKLHIKQNNRVLRMERIRYGNDVPICFEVATIPSHFVSGLSKDDVSGSLYRVLKEKKHLIPGKARQMFSATLASERIADYLKIKKGDAILYLRQTTALKDGTPFEYVRSQYVGKRFEFYLEK
ncbi:GntR family transcriptional regulator [Philodulcilactobacillus myokoensis]|uniref:GntR family transcriptional regulator n=1 Tax=Philodulcilactobacillus myokoensis TaxID=2929573 RepID=A0A9W6B1E8_9LACO|nr:GntR family transcriptional regulator [Philodulcilactobacillus myokoensis]GLB47194.1 GntR family transcriptional regulator [Philodulcilactobacillus myokoensis]